MAAGEQELVQHCAAAVNRRRWRARFVILDFFRLTWSEAWMGVKEMSEAFKQEGEVGLDWSKDSFGGSDTFVCCRVQEMWRSSGQNKMGRCDGA